MTNKAREADRRRPKRALRRESAIRATLLAGTALVGVALAQPAAAQTTEWLGGDIDWFDPANWDNGVPVGAGIARISNTSPGGTGPVIDQIGAESGDLSMRGVESRLTIENGGELATGTNAFIGSQVGTNAAVLVTGAGSNWEITGNLRVADSVDSVALVTVTDGAALQVDGNTTVALLNGGTGTLHISNGGSGNLQTTVMHGTEGGGLGRLVVEGNTSTLDTANLNIFSNGEIEFRDGAVITSTASNIGLSGGFGAADVLVKGGATWTVNGLTNFGYSRAATVTIEDGGSVNVNNNLFVGRQGNADGTVIIRDGGQLNAGSNVLLGWLADTQGLVEVTGAGSVFDVAGALFQVGQSGSGTVTISDSGVVNLGAGNPLQLATAAAGTGTLNIGAAAGDAAAATGTLNADTVEFSQGTATLVFNHTALAGDNYEFTADLESTGGGTHTINHLAGVTRYTGDGSGYTGSLLIEGGELILDGGELSTAATRIGDQAGSHGTLTIVGGGQMETEIGFPNVHLGSAEDSLGEVFIDGAGSRWALIGSSRLHVGHEGEGRLQITNGGALDLNDNLYVGGVSGAAGTGLVTVDGAGSQLTAQDLWIGQSGGEGEVSVLNGGKIILNSSLQAGLSGGGTAIIVINGAGSEVTSQNSFIGQGGNAELTISGGGKLESGVGADVGAGALRGTVLVTGQDSEWSVGTTFRLGLSGAGVLTIADNGLVSVGGSIQLATNAAGTGTLNIGAAAGDPAAAAGMLNADSVEFSEGAATIVFNHTATAGDNYVFEGDLYSTPTGTHALNHLAGVTNYTGDGSGFSGTTTVSGGTLSVNYALGGTVVVSDGVLGGDGTLGALTVNGGVLAPGNSIGTLNVASAIFNPGSTYEVELNDGGFVAGTNNDLLNATGAVTINGGTIHVTAVNGTDDGSSYTPGTYTIITAGGGVSGSFDAISDDFAFLSFADAYDANNVYLISSLVSPGFCLSGFTANQCASGSGVSSLGAGSALHDAVLVLANGDAPGALDQLSGEVHSSGKTALINNSARLRGIINNRINSAFGAEPLTESFPIMGYGPGDGLVDLAPAHRYGAWAQAYGAWDSTSATANTAAMRQDDRGFLIGADGHLGGAWHGGVFSGYGRTSFRADSRSSSGSSDNLHLGAYAGGELGAFNLNLGAAHTWHSIGTTRSVAFPGFTNTLTASYTARTMQLFGEASYRIDAGSARFEPFAGLAHANLHTNGFTEAGGAAALTSAASSTSTTFSTIGVRAATGFHMGDMKATARGMIGWRHAFGNTAPGSSFAFASGSSFVVSGAPIARNTAVLELGLDMEIGNNATLGLSYDGQFGSGTTSHSANARLAISF